MLNNKLCVLFGILLPAIVMGSFIYSGSKYFTYKAINKERLDPLGLFSNTNDVNSFEYKVATFGDSRAHEWARVFSKNNVPVLNLGIANQTSAQGRYRIDYQSQNLDLDLVIIQVGINDLKQITSASDNYLSIVSQCKNNIDYIALKAKTMAKTVVVSTIFPLGESPSWRHMFLGGEVNQAIDEVNAHIRNMQGVEVYDAYEFLVGDNGYVKDVYSRDVLHLNERAYTEMDVLKLLQ